MKVAILAVTALFCGSLHAQDGRIPPQAPQAHASQSEAQHIHVQGNLPTPDLLEEALQRPRMELADFVQLAEETNPTLKEARATVGRSEAQARQAGLYPDPSIGYQGEQIRGGDYGGGEQGGFLQQTVVLGGKMGLRRQIYKQQSFSDRIGVDEQTYRLHNDMARRFYTALASQTAVATRQKLLGIALDAVETVHQLANVGQADVPDVLQTEVEAERATIDFITAQRQFLSDFHRLAAEAGKPDLAACPLGGNLEDPPELDPQQKAAEIAAWSPAIQRARQEVAVAMARLRDAKRESIPDLELRAGEEYNGERIAQQPVAKAAGMQSFVTAGVNVPLWNRNQGNVAAAEAEVERARQDVVRIQLSVRETTEPLVQSYLSARLTADRYKTDLIPRAQKAYQLSLSKYQEMAQAYPQVLVSQRTLFEIQIDYVQALREVWTNAVALENYGLSGDLENPASSGTSNTGINLPNAGSGPE